MRLIMSGINGHYLRYITDNFASQTEEVLAAVAYATKSSLLFDWCWENNIPLKFYGRLDAEVAVSIPILTSFLKKGLRSLHVALSNTITRKSSGGAELVSI